MSYRDTLSATRQVRFDRAIDEAAAIIARARADRDLLRITAGPETVAEAAAWPGKERPLAGVVVLYEYLRDRARRKAAA